MEKGCTKIDADEMTSASSFLAAMGSWEKLVSTHAKYADLVLWSKPDFNHWSRFLFSMGSFNYERLFSPSICWTLLIDATTTLTNSQNSRQVCLSATKKPGHLNWRNCETNVKSHDEICRLWEDSNKKNYSYSTRVLKAVILVKL